MSKYPEHKYSKYIDQECSFNNIVNYPDKVDLVNELKNVGCMGNILLEPRLQEYLKKKRYYKDNHIEPCITLEKEFLITSRDIKVLKAFMKGRRDMYDPDNLEFNHFQQEKKQKKPSFPSKKLRKDPRMEKLKTCKVDMEHPSNHGMFVPDEEEGETYYSNIPTGEDMLHHARDLNYSGEGFSLDNAKAFNPRVDPVMNPGFEKYDKNKSQYRIGPPIINKPDPTADYRIIDPQFKRMDEYKLHYGTSNGRDPRNKYIQSDLNSKHSSKKNMLTSEAEYDSWSAPQDQSLVNTCDRVNFENAERYGDLPTPTFSGKSEMDTDLKIVTPTVGSRGKQIDTSRYTRTPIVQYDRPIKDVQIEDSMIRGMPANTKKSYGFRDASEYYFDYIDDDFQNPDNTVQPFPRGGEGTRLMNKKMAKQKYERILL